MNKKTILAIETSCDETAMSLIRCTQNKNEYQMEVLSNIVASQIDLHKKWGGVWPELASRAHLEAMIPVLQEALAPLARIKNKELRIKNGNANLNSNFLILNSIDSIAVTTGPGLIGSLLMGVETAQILGAYFDKPVVEVNHLEGHIYASFININEAKFKILNLKFKIAKREIFPILALVVSGGHTSLILMKNHLEYETVGQTIDDAAGEAFDKVARILGLGYPGGPAIEKFAVGGNENTYKLPLSMLNSKDLNFSFSGLKTAVLYLTKDPATGVKRPHNRQNLAASFQKTVAEILTKKTIQAIKKYRPKTIVLSGGVSANGYLREHFTRELSAFSLQTSAKILIPPKHLSTDNAVGIGIAGAIRFLNNRQTSWNKISARANFPIDQA